MRSLQTGLDGQLMGNCHRGQQNGGQQSGQTSGAIAAICETILAEYSPHILLGAGHIAQLNGVRFVGVVAEPFGDHLAIVWKAKRIFSVS